jgi:hypothetical protein
MARAGDFSELDKHAIPFVMVYEAEGSGGAGLSARFEINPDAVRYLESLKGKIAVVAVAGVYRTGKSYLLNAVRVDVWERWGPTSGDATAWEPWRDGGRWDAAARCAAAHARCGLHNAPR